MLNTLLETEPQHRDYHTTGWTVPLLRTELAQAGYPVRERTIRRTLHRLGWLWKRPKYVLGRPDPAYAEKRGRRLRESGQSWPQAARSGWAMRPPFGSFRRCERRGADEGGKQKS